MIKLFRKQKPVPTPTDLLVDLIAQRIIAQGVTKTYEWVWLEKNIICQYHTSLQTIFADLIEIYHFDKKINLSDKNKQTLKAALDIAYKHKNDLIEAKIAHDNELKSIDAIATILGI